MNGYVPYGGNRNEDARELKVITPSTPYNNYGR